MQQLVLAFSRRLRQLVRPMDVLARISPDHFCLITHQIDSTNATPASFRRLYDGLNHRAYKTAGGFFQLSVSVSLMKSVDKEEIDGELLLTRSLRGLDASHDGKRIVEQALSG